MRSISPRPARRRKRNRAELEHFLRPTKLLPTDGIVKATATEITRGAKTDIEKARAIYEWIVDNTFRDPKTRGCGRRRHPLHAGVQGSGREMRRPQRALCRPGPCRGPPGARRVWHPRRQIGAGIQEPRHLVGKHHQSAALPRRSLPRRLRLGACRSRGRAEGRAGRTARKSPAGRRDGEEGARAAIRLLGDELDGV